MISFQAIKQMQKTLLLLGNCKANIKMGGAAGLCESNAKTLSRAENSAQSRPNFAGKEKRQL